MDTSTLTLLRREIYNRFEPGRPSDPAVSTMLLGMIRAHCDPDDFEDNLDLLEEEEARYFSLDSMAAEHLFDELTFLLCGSECYRYEVYTIGHTEPAYIVVRMGGSNSVGAVYAAGEPEQIILIDEDMMFGGWKVPGDPALIAAIEDLCRT